MNSLKRWLSAFVFVCLAWQSSAQELPVPVRTDQGYVLKNAKGKVLTKKRVYEYIGWTDLMKDTTAYFHAGKYIGFRQQGRWGMMDVEGKEVMMPRFAQVNAFLNGLSVVSVQDMDSSLRYGAVDDRLELVIPVEYERVEPLYGTKNYRVAKKRASATLVGVLDAAGRPVIEPSYQDVQHYHKGMMRIQDKAGLWALTDAQGKLLTPFSYQQIEQPDSLGNIRVQTFGRIGLLDAQAKELLPTRHKDIAWVDSAYLVRYFPSYTCVDLQGNFKAKYDYDSLQNISPDIFRFVAGGKVGIMNSAEHVLTYGQYDEVLPFVDSLSVVRKGSYWGAIDQKGHLVLPLRFKSVSHEPHGRLRAAQYGEGPDLYDRKGRNLTDGQYSLIGSYEQGTYLMRRAGKYGYLDSALKEMMPPRFLHAEPFKGPYAVVREGRYDGVIDRQGKYVISPVMDRLLRAGEGIFVFEDNGFSGTINTDGIELYRAEQVELEVLPSYFIRIRKRGKVGLVTDRGLLSLSPVYDSISALRPDGTVFMYKGRKRYFKAVYEQGEPSDGAYDHLEWMGEPSDQFAAAKYKGNAGFVDFLGRFRISPRYVRVKPYHEGLAAFRIGALWGYINKYDQIVFQPSFEEASNFENGYAICRKQGNLGVVDKNGQVILPFAFQRIERTPYGNWYVWDAQGRAGIYRKDGKEGIYGKYERTQDKGNAAVATFQQGSWGLDRLDGLKIALPKYEQVRSNAYDPTFLLLNSAAAPMIFKGGR